MKFFSFLALAGLASAQVSPDVAKKLINIGRGVCVPETAEVYGPMHPKPPYTGVKIERDLKFGPDGQLWITDKQLGLLRMDPRSGKIEAIAQSYRNERLRGLNDLAFDASGGIYFTEPYGSSALKPDGRLVLIP